MDYYTRKTEACNDIDKYIKEGIDINIIYFKITTKYGLSEKFVDRRIEQLKLFVQNGKENLC